MRLRFRKVPACGALGTRWPRRGAAQARALRLARRRGAARGLRRSLLGARPADPRLTWSAQVGTGAGRGAGAQARDPASPLPTPPAGAHLGDSQRKRSLGAASLGNAGGPAGRQEAAAEEELSRAATGRHGHPSRRRHLHLALGPRGQSPGWPPLPAACPAHLPGKPASSRPGSCGPSEGTACGTAPELPAAGWTRSRERVSVAPPRERPAGLAITPVAGTPRQPQSLIRGRKSPWSPLIVLGRAGLRRRRCAPRLANLG